MLEEFLNLPEKAVISLDKLRYIKEYCITHNLTHFIFGARNENSRVQRIFQHVGFEAIGSENVFHIPSLLSSASDSCMERNIDCS